MLFLRQTVAVSLLYLASCVAATELADCKAVLTGQTLSLHQASGFVCRACYNCIKQTVCISTSSASQVFEVPLLQSTLFKQQDQVVPLWLDISASHPEYCAAAMY